MGSGVPPVRSTLQEYAFRVAVWRKARPLFVYRTRKLRSTLLEYAFRVAVWRKAHPPFVPGPMILGAQAPGKVGHRQVTSEKTISNEVVFSVFYCRSVLGPTLQEYAFRDAVWRKARPPFVFDPHCWSMRFGSQCGEKLVRFSYTEHGS